MPKKPPLCKCGCGKPVNARYGDASRPGGWKLYIDGHREMAPAALAVDELQDRRTKKKKTKRIPRETKPAAGLPSAYAWGSEEAKQVTINLKPAQLDRLLVSLPLDTKTKLLQQVLGE